MVFKCVQIIIVKLQTEYCTFFLDKWVCTQHYLLVSLPFSYIQISAHMTTKCKSQLYADWLSSDVMSDVIFSYFKLYECNSGFLLFFRAQNWLCLSRWMPTIYLFTCHHLPTIQADITEMFDKCFDLLAISFAIMWENTSAYVHIHQIFLNATLMCILHKLQSLLTGTTMRGSLSMFSKVDSQHPQKNCFFRNRRNSTDST